MLRHRSSRFPLSSVARPALMACLLGGALTACTVGPDYQRPDTPQPAAYRETVTGDVGKDAALRAEIAADWWRQFNSPELDGLIARVSSSNFDVRAAVARIRQAEGTVDEKRSSLFPSVTGDLGRTRSRSGGTTTSGGTRTSINSTYSAQLSASYELDFWGKNRSALESAKASLDYSRYDKQTVLMTAIATVATDYFQALAYKDRLALARRSLQDAEDVLRGIRARAQAGTATAVDVANQVNVVEGERAAIPQYEQSLAQQIDALAVLVGVLPEQLKIEGTTLNSLAQPEVAPNLPSTLLARRPDVASAEAQLIAANATLRNVIAQQYPSLSLTGSYGYQNSSLSDLFNPASKLWSIGSSLSQTVFDAGNLQAQSDVQRARVEELAADYQKAVVTAFADVEDALAGVRYTRDIRSAQEKATASADEALRGTTGQFQRGTADMVSVLTAQRTLFSAQDSLVQSRLNYLTAIVTLYRVLGGGWSVEQTQAAADNAPGRAGG
ncbi:efflux transporter outer membrane subunit [Nitrospirillum iridis]|uniref:NodT family efflux transporter outer membrane factor (OMF) lipoprotein n=1 Tax=Nitrospirillum iridis TaxID=765888 RepID=A0A7X0ECZ4_9PROT|nr:efflux transporter outer membrane subunit [Nitrospirillum iridis]MBB6252208.1 NodT family efflux transporter outer membrane factor (OMF) lipoprotein [Nitrospirillum iridis]